MCPVGLVRHRETSRAKADTLGLRAGDPGSALPQHGICAGRFDKRNRICNCTGVYKIRFARDVQKDLVALSAYHRVQVIEAIETQLQDAPTTPTRNRKLLVNLIPPWTAEPPIWELRVGEYRVFYDVSEAEETVYVRAVRRKPPRRTTEEII